MYKIIYIEINYKLLNYLYFSIKIHNILKYNFKLKNKFNKLYLYNILFLYFVYFNNKNKLKFKTLKLSNNYFLKKKRRRSNDLIYSFFNNYLINFLSFLLNKKIYFSLKKVNHFVRRFKKNNIIRMMSRKLRKHYRFINSINFFNEFIEVL